MQPIRVVVTGLGTINPLGNCVNDFWNGLTQGHSAIKRITSFDVSNLSCKIAAQVHGFDPRDYVNPKDVIRFDQYMKLAIAASKQAYEDSKLSISESERSRCGVVIGTGIGGIETTVNQTITAKDDYTKVSPFMITSSICNMAAGVVAIELKFTGPCFCVVSACATGTHSIGEAYMMLKTGQSDIAIAGGSESAITFLPIAGFCSMKALSSNFNDFPEKASRPFDAKRDGFVMGEGAGAIVLETLEHAEKRGAHIYCELAGYSASCDAHHITQPDLSGRALCECFKKLIQTANISIDEVDYINAHGTSTYFNDLVETKAIKEVFGENAKKINISSIKSMIGHLLGAAGAVEAISTIKTIESGIIPPTINYENKDKECDLNYTPNVSVKRDVNVAISDNLGFGGQNAAICFKKFKK